MNDGIIALKGKMLIQVDWIDPRTLQKIGHTSDLLMSSRARTIRGTASAGGMPATNK